jgi:hypothetical protein
VSSVFIFCPIMIFFLPICHLHNLSILVYIKKKRTNINRESSLDAQLRFKRDLIQWYSWILSITGMFYAQPISPKIKFTSRHPFISKLQNKQWYPSTKNQYHHIPLIPATIYNSPFFNMIQFAIVHNQHC